ncbi:sodium:calcium antiporter [Chitinivibrio alkaliphilus]|uniref:CaCA family Na(+)/Ca(+) antiporter n=1 Tax=Chitinivibrio alkaliphilus ACht1 TaxID=1313304 RepID=U7D704_9BACT|nr:sodium:calcium antiporter [Chitinivibrio alkaliphilus]ERP31326.1 CaCA family Na(+)/Ca(+) antiporter [Chitinivibrio alkaliphilus ACht1]
MTLFIWAVILIASLAVLIKASDLFLDGAERTGHYFHLPLFTTGLIIVAVGTSLPELASSILAVLHDAGEIVAGNVVGSNIANMLLVLGTGGLFFRGSDAKPHRLGKDTAPLLISAGLLYLLLGTKTIPSWTGVVLLLLAVLYVLTLGRRGISPLVEPHTSATVLKAQDVVKLFFAPICIYLSAEYTIIAVISLAEKTALSQEIMALSAIALGTSLPEAAVSYSAARRGNMSLIFGNIVGSTIFNSLVVVGGARLFGPLAVGAAVQGGTRHVFLGALCIFILYTRKKILPK